MWAIQKRTHLMSSLKRKRKVGAVKWTRMQNFLSPRNAAKVHLHPRSRALELSNRVRAVVAILRAKRKLQVWLTRCRGLLIGARRSSSLEVELQLEVNHRETLETDHREVTLRSAGLSSQSCPLNLLQVISLGLDLPLKGRNMLKVTMK